MNKIAPEITTEVKPRMGSIDSGVQVSLQDEPPGVDVDVRVDVEAFSVKGRRVPKRVLHFCDGTLEEYSSDEDEADNSPPEGHVSTINASSLAWGPWLVYQTIHLGNVALSACDYVGETVATFFGLTSPKYGSELEEYKKVKAEEEERKKQTEIEMAGWNSGTSNNVELSQAKSKNGVQLDGNEWSDKK